MVKFLRKEKVYANADIGTRFLIVSSAAIIFFTVGSYKIFIRAFCTLYDPVEAEPFKDSGHGRWADPFQMLAYILLLRPERHIFAPADSFQHL